jgi:hypothetical protein
MQAVLFGQEISKPGTSGHFQVTKNVAVIIKGLPCPNKTNQAPSFVQIPSPFGFEGVYIAVLISKSGYASQGNKGQGKKRNIAPI